MPEGLSSSVDSEGSQQHPSCPPADNALQWFHKQNPQVPLVSSLLRTAQFPWALPTHGSFHLHWLLQDLSVANTSRAWHCGSQVKREDFSYSSGLCETILYIRTFRGEVMCVAAWENLSRWEILTFPMIYISENLPELKYVSNKVMAVIVWKVAFIKLVQVWRRCLFLCQISIQQLAQSGTLNSWEITLSWQGFRHF